MRRFKLRSAPATEIASIAVIVAIGLAARISWAAWAHATPNFDNDGAFYHAIAVGISRGDGYRSPFGAATTYVPPAYPSLLALALKFGDGARIAAVLLNAGLGVLAVLAVYFFARPGLRAGPAILLALLLALLPSQIISTAVFFPDALFAALTFFGLGLYVRSLKSSGGPWIAFAGGVFLGIATLAESQLVLFPVLLAIHFLAINRWRLRSLFIGCLPIVGAALVVLPWCISNVVRIGDVGPVSTNGGVAFWIGHHDGATGHIESPGPIREVATNEDLTVWERYTNRMGYRRGLAYAVKHPGPEFANVWKKLFFTFGDDEEWMQLNENHGSDPIISQLVRDYWFSLSNIYYYMIVTLGVVGILLTWRRWNAVMTVALIFACYWIALHAMFYGEARFHTALLPVFALFAAIAAMTILRRATYTKNSEPIGASQQR